MPHNYDRRVDPFELQDKEFYQHFRLDKLYTPLRCTFEMTRCTWEMTRCTWWDDPVHLWDDPVHLTEMTRCTWPTPPTPTWAAQWRRWREEAARRMRQQHANDWPVLSTKTSGQQLGAAEGAWHQGYRQDSSRRLGGAGGAGAAAASTPIEAL
jgi:hypothetical protein